MRRLDDVPLQAILLVANEDLCDMIIPPGVTRFRVNLEGVSDLDALYRAVASEMIFPHHGRGLDALLDLMSDSDWFGNSAGYVLEFTGVDEVQRLNPDLLTRLAALLPLLADRWRSSGVSFRVVVHSEQPARDVLRIGFDSTNAAIERAKLMPWNTDLEAAEVIVDL